MRNAVVEARSESETEHPVPSARPDSSLAWWQLAAAACILAVAVKVIVPYTTLYLEPDIPRPRDIAVKIEETEQPRTGALGTTMSEEEIGGTRIIQAEGSLTLSDVKIMDGARVTIRANEVVAFGNGFRSDAKLN